MPPTAVATRGPRSGLPWPRRSVRPSRLTGPPTVVATSRPHRPTFAHVAFLTPLGINAPRSPLGQHGPTWRTRGRAPRQVLPGTLEADWPAGTAPLLGTVCFACPTKTRTLFGKEMRCPKLPILTRRRPKIGTISGVRSSCQLPLPSNVSCGEWLGSAC